MKRRSREQILRSLLSPPAPAQAPGGRAHAAHKAHALGPSARTLVASGATRLYRRERLRPLVQPLPIALAAGTAGAVLMLLGARDLVAALAVGVVCLAAGFGLAQGAIGAAARQAAHADIELAAAFDVLIGSAARELPENALTGLARIKAQLVRLLAQMPELRRSGTLAADDERFVRQTVARYVPDALTPYLALSSERRSRGVAHDDPRRLLDEQLGLISCKLDALLQRADEARVAALRRNRVFLRRTAAGEMEP